MGRTKQTARKNTGGCLPVFRYRKTDEEDSGQIERQCTGGILPRTVDRLSYLLNRDSDEDSNDSLAVNYYDDHNSSNLEFSYSGANETNRKRHLIQTALKDTVGKAPQSQLAKKSKIEEHPAKTNTSSEIDKGEAISERFAKNLKKIKEMNEIDLSTFALSPLHGKGYPYEYLWKYGTCRKSTARQPQFACKKTGSCFYGDDEDPEQQEDDDPEEDEEEDSIKLEFTGELVTRPVLDEGEKVPQFACKKTGSCFYGDDEDPEQQEDDDPEEDEEEDSIKLEFTGELVTRPVLDEGEKVPIKSESEEQTIINNEIEKRVLLIKNEQSMIHLPKIEIVTETDGVSPYETIENKRIDLPKTKHPVTELYEICSKKRLGRPEFTIVDSKILSRKFLMKVRVNNVDYRPDIDSSDLKAAKMQAAICCLKALKILI